MEKIGRGGLGLSEGRSIISAGVNNELCQVTQPGLERCDESDLPPKPDAREGVVTIALLEAGSGFRDKGLPAKIQDVLARNGLDGSLT